MHIKKMERGAVVPRALGVFQLTVSLAALRSEPVSNLALVLQVEVPGLFFAVGILDVEGDDGLGLFEGVLAVSLVGLERLVDDVEGGGRGVGICRLLVPGERKRRHEYASIPFLRDMVDVVVKKQNASR